MEWLAAHWLDLVQTVGIVGGLLLTFMSVRRERQAGRADALFRLTERHGELWREQLSKPGLSRVMSPVADPEKEPLTEEEVVFLTLLFLHLNTAYSAIRAGLLREPEGLTLDMRTVFSLPIPRAGWERMRPLQDRDFAAFVDERRG